MFVIGSPPCTMFSRLTVWNKKRMKAGTYDRRITEARLLLDFAIEILVDCQGTDDETAQELAEKALESCPFARMA